jgi:type IV secretory pathway VirB10-like protein
MAGLAAIALGLVFGLSALPLIGRLSPGAPAAPPATEIPAASPPADAPAAAQAPPPPRAIEPSVLSLAASAPPPPPAADEAVVKAALRPTAVYEPKTPRRIEASQAKRAAAARLRDSAATARANLEGAAAPQSTLSEQAAALPPEP